MLNKKQEKKIVCSKVVTKVIVPISSSRVIDSHYEKGKKSCDYVHFVVYEQMKPREKRTSDDRKLIINDHRETTLRAARDQSSSRSARKKERYVPQIVSLAEAVQLPARVVVVTVTTKTGDYTFINLFQREGRKASGLFVVLSELLIKEKLFLGTIVKHEPLWWWGGRKSTSFGPSGDTLPVVALTDEDRKIIFNCRKSGDLVTLGGEVKTMSTLPL